MSKKTWKDLSECCKCELGFDAKQIAIGTILEELQELDSRMEVAEFKSMWNERAMRLADIIGSSGDMNSRNAAILILKALDVDEDAFRKLVVERPT